MAKLVIALLLFGIAALLGLLVFAQPDWLSLNSTRTIGLALAFGFSGSVVSRLP